MAIILGEEESMVNRVKDTHHYVRHPHEESPHHRKPGLPSLDNQKTQVKEGASLLTGKPVALKGDPNLLAEEYKKYKRLIG